MQMRNQVTVPDNPNLDKLAMLWMTDRMFSLVNQTLGLVSDYKIGFFTTGSLPDGTTWRDFPQVLFYDCAGSPLDGHGENREKSGFQLLAEELGLSNERRFKRLIYQVTYQDKNGRDKVRGHIASVVAGASRVGRPYEEIRNWVFDALDAIADWEEFEAPRIQPKGRNGQCVEPHPWFDMSIQSIRSVMNDEIGDTWFNWGKSVLREIQTLMTKAKTEFDNSTHRVIATWKGSKCLSVFHSTNPYLAGCALKNGHVVISQLETAVSTTMQIIVPKGSGLHLQQVVAKLRKAEAKSRGIEIDTSWEVLGCQGKHPEVPNIHVLENDLFQVILVGSEQHPFVKQLLLSLEDIVEIVAEGLKPLPLINHPLAPGGRSLEGCFLQR